MKKFLDSLSHSARITVVTCGCFILLTMLILIFLMCCPIRESSAANHVNDNLIVTGITAQTTDTMETTQVTTHFSRRTTDPTRDTSTTTETTVVDYEEPYDDPYQEPDDTPNYQTPAYVVTTKKPTYQAPVVTKPAAPLETQAPPVQTAAPAEPVVTQAPQEPEDPPATIPAPDENGGT